MNIPRAAGLGAALLAVCLLTPGCLRMAPIVTDPPLMAPAGLTMGQIEAAIRAGIVRANQNSHGVWRVEKSAPGVVVAGLDQRNGEAYLQVTFNYNQVRVISRITNSRNEDQTATEINRRANVWYMRLDGFVQQELLNRAPS